MARLAWNVGILTISAFDTSTGAYPGFSTKMRLPRRTTTSVPTPSQTPTPTTTPEKDDLLKKYAPILYMHPDERYYPTNAQTMLDNSELWENGKLKGKLVNKNKKNALKLKHLKI